MKTTVEKNGSIDNKVNGIAASAKTDSKPQITNGKAEIKALNNGKADHEARKAEAPAQISEKLTPQAESVKPEIQAAPKPEETKAEVKAEKPALNLESTLKLVEELHRRKIQRDRLLDTIDTLEAFEVAQINEADETEANHFQGCVLIIEDDTRRKFSTKNPVIIQAVAQFVNHMCVNRLAEIEAGITIPA